jgi:hypothetical protein
MQDRMNKVIVIVILSFTHIFYHTEGMGLARDLYNAIQFFDTDKVIEIINKGGDPNYCIGEAGWVDSNPLAVLSWYNTRRYFGSEKKIPEPIPDIAVLDILVNGGADINRRPYIWAIVYQANNDSFETIIRHRKYNHESMDKDDIIEEEMQFVNDVNRLLKGYLDAGADPDKLGHPYPYSNNLGVVFLSDKRANKYFSKGTRAINIAIEKGILWESQVNLLLQYTNLDETSLEAAERSKDPAMIEKINKLWELQNSQKHGNQISRIKENDKTEGWEGKK